MRWRKGPCGAPPRAIPLQGPWAGVIAPARPGGPPPAPVAVVTTELPEIEEVPADEGASVAAFLAQSKGYSQEEIKMMRIAGLDSSDVGCTAKR